MTHELLSTVPGGRQGIQSAISRAFFPYEIEASPIGARFQGAIANHQLGPLRLTRTRVNGAFAGRRSGRPSDDPVTYSLLYIEDGGDVVFHTDGYAVAPAGSLVLMSSLQPLETEQRSGGTSMAVSFAAAPLRSHLPDIEQWCFAPTEAATGAGAILRDTLLACWRVGDAVMERTDDLACSLAYLVSAAFKPRSDQLEFSSEAARSHFLRIRDFVERHLASPSLSADRIAGELGLSKSYLFAIMNGAGTTLGRLILESRLDQGRRLLHDPSLRDWAIRDIAAATGFCDAAHFSRTFSARFGLSPRAFRSRRALADAISLDTEPV